MASRSTPLDARRAEVAKLRVKRLTTREIAARIGVSQPTIVRDLAELSKEWAAQRGDYNAQLEATLRDIDDLQRTALQVLDEAIGLDKLPAIDRAFKTVELRAKLEGLFPKGTSEAGETPTGDIEIFVTMLATGNQELVTESLELDEGVVDVEYTEVGAGQ